MNEELNEKLKLFLNSKKKKRLNYIDTSPPSRPATHGKHLHFNRLCFLPPPPSPPPCLSRSLTLLDWTFLLQKQFSIIICNATPQCRMQMLLALAAPAWQLLTEHRCGRPLRQNKVEAANNVITQSLHIGVHSLQAAVDSGHCWHRLGNAREVTGCQERNAHNIISSAVQDSSNSTKLHVSGGWMLMRGNMWLTGGVRGPGRLWLSSLNRPAACLVSQKAEGGRGGGVVVVFKPETVLCSVWFKGQTCCFTLVQSMSRRFLTNRLFAGQLRLTAWHRVMVSWCGDYVWMD